MMRVRGPWFSPLNSVAATKPGAHSRTKPSNVTVGCEVDVGLERLEERRGLEGRVLGLFKGWRVTSRRARERRCDLKSRRRGGWIGEVRRKPEVKERRVAGRRGRRSSPETWEGCCVVNNGCRSVVLAMYVL